LQFSSIPQRLRDAHLAFAARLIVYDNVGDHLAVFAVAIEL